MQKEIMANPAAEYKENTDLTFGNTEMSEELQEAIENLIYRMRELGPLTSPP